MGLAADRVRGFVLVDLASSRPARGGGVMHPLLLAALVAAATWDAWRWYFARVSAAPEEAAALALTVAFLGALGVARIARSVPPRPLPLVPVAILLAAYAASHFFLPPIVRAALAISVTFYCLHLAAFRERPPIAFWGLVALALPVLPSLQFTLGYPMRVVSAALTVGLLQTHGLMVARQGTFLVWRDEMVQFDAPCSGVNMLWAGLLLTLMGCVFLRLGALKVAIALVVSVALAIACNVLRAASLFYVETGLIPAAPTWWHDGIGIAAFVLSAGVTLWLLGRLREREALAWSR
jgi:exosortase/archaeosortase family protein